MLRLKPSTPRGAFVLLLLIAAAFLGNLLSVNLVYSVDFLFGSIAYLLVALLFGPFWGLGVATLSSVWTYTAWGHPWAVVIFSAEALLVGLAWRRTGWSVVVLDSLYWLLVGMPLVAVCYLGLMGMEPLAAGVVMVKQAANGIFNAVVVSLFLLGMTVRGRLGAERSVRTSEVLFALLTAFVFVPALVLTVLDSRDEMARIDEGVAADVERTADVTAQRIDQWHAHHLRAVDELARRASELGPEPSPDLQRATSMMARSHPDFHNMYVANAEGVTVAFHPPVNASGESTLGLDFSDREYFQRLRARRRPVVSRVFMGRGGVTSPIITLSVPIVEDERFRGYALGALDLMRLGELLRQHGTHEMEMTLVSAEEHIVASSDPAVPAMRPMPDDRAFQRAPIGHGVVRLEPHGPELPAMVRDRRSSYVHRRSLAGALPWSLSIRVPVAPYQAAMYESQVTSFAITLAFAALAMLLAWVATRWVASPLAHLARVTRDLPEQVTRGREPAWPQTAIWEVASLIDTFRAMASRLRSSFHDIRRHSEELSRSNEALQAEITERRQVEQALREGEGRLRALLEAAPFAVLIVDGDDRVVDVNDRAAATFGGTVEDLVGLEAEALIPGHRTEVRREVDAGEGREVAVVEREGMRQDGSRFPVQVSLAPVEFGGARYLMTTAVDVTEHKEMETRAQEQERLAAVGQLAAGIAHDFNNLLTVVLGFAQMLLEREDLPRDARQDVAEISSQAERAAQLVRQILDFSRRTVVEREPVEMTGFLRDAVAMLERTLPETISLELSELPPACWVEASPTQLQQVVTNLALNARDAMDDGGVLRLSLRSEEVKVGARPPLPGMSTGTWAALEVADTGVGMRPDIQEHVFEPFFTTKGPDRGTGLGLAQVHGIVKQHGGEISVRSAPGAGTTFSIYLPCEARPAEEAPAAPPTPRAHGRGQTVLVVEDEAQVRSVLARMLEAHGYRVVEARDGRDALDCVDTRPVDLVLTDLVMPVMDGRSLVDAIRRKGARVPVITMSGYPLHDTPEPEPEEPISARLEKPLEMDTLIAAVDEALRRPTDR
ncbi:MAG: ATP-binding protein [Myxococcota bacterium]